MIIAAMSHSPEKRREDKKRALRAMCERTEDQMIYCAHFRPQDFPDIIHTTWNELESEQLIEEANRKGPVEYRPTGG